MFDENDLTRRTVLQGALGGIVGAAMPTWFTRENEALMAEAAFQRPRRIGPNDTIQVAVIGPGGPRGGFQQGLGVTRWIASKKGVKVVAACDVDGLHLENAAKAFGPDTAKYKDFREVVARKDIDAVVIGTPDHWHSTIAIAAMNAGKDVYCEKPLTLTIQQGKDLVRVWRRTKAVFQTGSQQRSDARFRLACELVRNGRLGKLQRVVAHLPQGPTGGPFDPEPIPEDFDWNMWQGPAPEREYTPQRTHGSFRWWMEYSGGMLTDWGAHHHDIAQWGIGTDDTGPISVEGTAKNQPNIGTRNYTTIPEYRLSFKYANGVELISTHEGDNGVEFFGENGWIYVGRGFIRASDQKLLDEPLPATATKLYASDDHAGNFVDCIRSRKDPICHAGIGHRSVSICHLANICLRLGGAKLIWDPAKEDFVGNAIASAMTNPPMRKWA